MAILTVGNALCMYGGVPLPVAATNNFVDHRLVSNVTSVPTIKSVESRRLNGNGKVGDEVRYTWSDRAR